MTARFLLQRKEYTCCSPLNAMFFLTICCIADEYPDEGLKKLLVFITGTSQVPALGFMPEASVTFRHKCDLQADDPTVEFPVANTCANTIALPCSVHTYSVFKDRMQAAVDINVFTAE